MKQQIISALKGAMGELRMVDVEPTVEVPNEPSHGDYSSNIAMAAFKKYQVSSSKYKVFRTPLELARRIVGILNTKYLIPNTCDRVEAVAPGFINFWLAKDYMVKWLHSYIAKNHAAMSSHAAMKNKRIMVEFADPNPFKEFHIGHLRNISLGESFARLLESQGAQVWRVNYQGDVGMHIAKAIYGLLRLCHAELGSASVNEILKRAQNDNLGKTKMLGEAYTLGAKAYEEDENAKKETQALNVKIYRNDPQVHQLWEIGRKWSLEQFEQIYKRVGTTYNRYYFESEVADPGRKIVLEHVKDGIFEKHDGAVIFRGEGEGLHTRVFVTKEDYATYEAKDMALAGIKYQDFPYDRSIIITAHEQAPYFKVVLAAMRKVFPELAAKTTHLSFGFVRLKDTKMSSRLGNIITGEWLLDEAKDRIKKEFPEMDEETAEQVAVGAVKYSLLKVGTASDIAFSFEESINLEGNSGPYLQYTFARTQSVLSKVKTTTQNLKFYDKLNPEELTVLRILHRFPEIVREASQKFAPNLVCDYLFDLAQQFNLFYQKHKILPPVILGSEATPGSEMDSGQARMTTSEKDIYVFRLALTAAVGQTLKNGLYLLGIQSPERM